MTVEAFVLLALLAATLASFFFELLPVDVTALGLLAALVLTGLVPLSEAMAGFSNHGVLTIGGLFVLSHALTRTGVLEVVAVGLSRRFGHHRWGAVGVLLVLVALMSAFLNNTAVVAMTLPLAVDLCRRLELSPSKVLIPLSFAAIFGGTLTLIGTSTNLLVSSLLREGNEVPLGMFELTPLGAVFLLAGMAYVLLLAPRALPERATTESLTREFDMGDYLTEVQVTERSKLVGKTVRDVEMSERYDVTTLAVLRDERRIVDNLRNVVFRPGDLLLVRGDMNGLLRLRRELDVALLTDVKLSDRELTGGGQVVVEALIAPNSPLIGRTLAEVDFRRRHSSFVLAVRREEKTLRQRLARTALRFADTLLIVTTRDQLNELRRSEDLILTSQPDLHLQRERLWWLPLLLIPAVMVLAATELVDLLLGVLVSVVILLAAGVIRPQESYQSVEWRVVVFIAAFIPVGEAMFRTGLAEVLAHAVALPGTWFPAQYAPWVAVSVLYLATSLATESITNNAAAIILTPVAIQLGGDLGVDARPFILAVCFAASASFLTPTGYQTNMMVYGHGKYRFTDFTRFGGPLNLLFWLLATLLIPVIWPF